MRPKARGGKGGAVAACFERGVVPDGRVGDVAHGTDRERLTVEGDAHARSVQIARRTDAARAQEQDAPAEQQLLQHAGAPLPDQLLGLDHPPIAAPSIFAIPSMDRSGGFGAEQCETAAHTASNPSSSPRRWKKAFGNFMAEATRVYFQRGVDASRAEYPLVTGAAG